MAGVAISIEPASLHGIEGIRNIQGSKAFGVVGDIRCVDENFYSKSIAIGAINKLFIWVRGIGNINDSKSFFVMGAEEIVVPESHVPELGNFLKGTQLQGIVRIREITNPQTTIRRRRTDIFFMGNNGVCFEWIDGGMQSHGRIRAGDIEDHKSADFKRYKSQISVDCNVVDK